MSKRILILQAENICEGDFSNNNIYTVFSDNWVLNDGHDTSFKYTKEVEEKYSNAIRFVGVKDNKNEEVHIPLSYKDSPRFIIYDSDKELAYKLIDMIDGLDTAIVNIVIAGQNN